LGENESGIFLICGLDTISDNQKLFVCKAMIEAGLTVPAGQATPAGSGPCFTPGKKSSAMSERDLFDRPLLV
jgi:hypothetical protein